MKRLQTSARMMKAFQHGVLTLHRLRTGGTQSVFVQHIHVQARNRLSVCRRGRLRNPQRCELAGRTAALTMGGRHRNKEIAPSPTGALPATCVSQRTQAWPRHAFSDARRRRQDSASRPFLRGERCPSGHAVAPDFSVLGSSLISPLVSTQGTPRQHASNSFLASQ
jgi:hypothetical protein